MEVTIKTSLFFLICLQYLFSPTLCQFSLPCNDEDKQILLQVKKEFRNPSIFSTWNANTDCCNSWRFVSCNNDLRLGRVSSLSFDNVNEITGQIPPTIGNLTYLKVLRFSRLPNLIGPIPETITRLPDLEVFTITQNKKLSGSIPNFSDQMKSVGTIELYSNSFTGTIPSSLSLVPNLFRLDLSSNKLTGSIPVSFGSFKRNVDLKLMNNKLSGTIPRSLAQADLLGLDVSGNQFTGDVSFILGGTRLNDFIIRQNHFKFDFTNVRLSQNLGIIDIAHNEIYGSIPKEIGQLPVLQTIDFSYNQLCGPIPSSLKQFNSSAFAHNKCLCGAPLPPCK